MILGSLNAKADNLDEHLLLLALYRDFAISAKPGIQRWQESVGFMALCLKVLKRVTVLVFLCIMLKQFLHSSLLCIVVSKCMEN